MALNAGRPLSFRLHPRAIFTRRRRRLSALRRRANLVAADVQMRFWQSYPPSDPAQNMVDSGGVGVVFSGERAAAGAVVLGVFAAHARLDFRHHPARL